MVIWFITNDFIFTWFVNTVDCTPLHYEWNKEMKRPVRKLSWRLHIYVDIDLQEGPMIIFV